MRIRISFLLSHDCAHCRDVDNSTYAQSRRTSIKDKAVAPPGVQAMSVCDSQTRLWWAAGARSVPGARSEFDYMLQVASPCQGQFTMPARPDQLRDMELRRFRASSMRS